MEISTILKSGYAGFLESETFLYHRIRLNRRNDLLKSLARPLIHFVLSFAKSSVVEEKNLGLVLTRNQYKFVCPIVECLDDNIVKGVKLEGELDLSVGNLGRLYKFNLKWILIGWRVLKGLSVIDKLHLLLYYHGYYLGAKRFFEKSNVNRLIVSNEVHPCLRFIVLAARSSGVETVLIPHTLPSKKFPAIIHDKVFFRGESSIEKYRISEYTKVYMVGDPSEFEKVERVNTCMGIAVNALDDLDAVAHLIKRILNAHKCVAIKLHPVFKDVPVELLDFADMIREDMFDFFSEIQCLVTGNSAIVVDALKQGIPVYLFEWVNDDVFGFWEYKIAPPLSAKLIEEIVIEDKIYGVDDTDFNLLLCDYGVSSRDKILRILMK